MVLDGYKYSIYVNDIKLENVESIKIKGNKVIVKRIYHYNGFNGGDYVNITSDTYDINDIKVCRR